MSEHGNGNEAGESEMRKHARRRLAKAAQAPVSLEPRDEVLHELQVHQIQLEMQNETLRQSQVELEQSRDRYRDLFEFAPVGYAVVGEDDTITAVNHAAADLIGMAPALLLNRRFASLIREQDRSDWRKHFHAHQKGGEYRSCELVLERASGSPFHARLECVRINRAGAFTAMRVAIIDISVHKLAEQAMINEARRRDEFLAMLAHELRAPLAPIRTAGLILGQLESDDERLQWTREVIERQVTHLARLLDDLLDVSRAARGTISVRISRVELKSIISHAVETTRPLIDSKGQQLGVRLQGETLAFDADASRLTQMLINLLENAAKYTPEGGKIELDSGVVGNEIRIVVRNNGTGIEPDQLPTMFELFRQGERGLDRQQGGLGIGLTLARRLVELQGGQLTAKSGGIGCGSEFSITLSAAARDTPVPVQGPTPTPAHSPASNFRRVLLVDDDALVLTTLSVFLAREGFQVKTAGIGLAAIEVASNFRPDLVLLDIGLLGMNGFEVAQALRKLEPDARRMCLVAVSGYGDEQTRAANAEAGFDAHYTKSVDYKALIKKLAVRGEKDGALRAPGLRRVT